MHRRRHTPTHTQCFMHEYECELDAFLEKPQLFLTSIAYGKFRTCSHNMINFPVSSSCWCRRCRLNRYACVGACAHNCNVNKMMDRLDWWRIRIVEVFRVFGIGNWIGQIYTDTNANTNANADEQNAQTLN